MQEAIQRIGSRTGRVRVATPAQLDALVGEYVTGDPPEIAWQDSYGFFQFDTRAEAEEAISNSYHRLFRPDLDWDAAWVEEVRRYPRYSSDLTAAWEVVECLSANGRKTEICRHGDFWRAGFAGTEAFGATPAMAICLAALRSKGVDPIFCDSLLDENPASCVDSEEETETLENL